MNIWEAARNGQVDILKKLIADGIDVNTKSSQGNTALIIATDNSNSTSNIKTVKFLLESGANVNIHNNNGSTALALATSHSNTTSNLETVRILLDSGADINFRSGKGNTALIIGTDNSNTTSNFETVKLLLERKANVNIQNNNGNTALIFASSHSNSTSSLETVKLLLDAGADINVQNNNGDTALTLASDFSTVELLLQYGADPFINTNNMNCQSEECIRLVEAAAWKKLRARDLDSARRFAKNALSKKTFLSKDVWYLILSNERQRRLCKNLYLSTNKYLLIEFAIDVGADPEEVKNMTKAQLCGLISRQIGKSSGTGSSYLSKDTRNLNNIEKQILDLAYMYNIDTSKPVKKILSDLYSILK